MSNLDLTEAVDAAARVLYELRHPPDDECPHIPWEDTYQPGWRDDVLPLITAAAPFIAAQAAEAERGWWVRAVEQIWLGLGPTGRCESGQPLLDLLALRSATDLELTRRCQRQGSLEAAVDKRRGGE